MWAAKWLLKAVKSNSGKSAPQRINGAEVRAVPVVPGSGPELVTRRYL